MTLPIFTETPVVASAGQSTGMVGQPHQVVPSCHPASGNATSTTTPAVPVLRIVGLDLSLNRTGIATVTGADSLSAPSGVIGFARMRWIRARVLEWTNTADLVVVEAPAFSSNGKYAKEIAGLWHVVMISIDARSTRWIDVMSNSVKKYATGNGRADKSEMLAAAIKRLPIDVDNDDEADAAWLCAIGHEIYGDPLAVMPAVNRTALDAIRVRTEQAS